METVREKLQKMLVSKGMFESQAEEVIKLAIPELKALLDDYEITLDRPSEEYPQSIYDVLFFIIKPIALRWIEKNKPEAWYKEMFV